MGGNIIDNGWLLLYCKIMRRFLVTSLALLLSLAAYSQSSSQEEIIREINRISSGIHYLECDFVQTKHLKILSDKMVSKGKMYFEQPGRLRWEYLSPYEYVFILNGDQVMLKNAARTDVIDVNRNKMFKEIARIMMNSIMGSCLSDEKSFNTTIKETPEEWVATLIPLKKDMKQMWSKLVLHFDRARKIVSMVEMYENNGDHTTIVMQNVSQNKPIDKAVFNIE